MMTRATSRAIEPVIRPSKVVMPRCQQARRAFSSSPGTRPVVPTPSAFKYFCAFQTRWKDNDVYSHLNNIEYNAYFDSIVNQYMLHHVGTQLPHPAGLKRMTTPLGLAISSTTTFTASLSYPNPVVGALAVEQLGNSSVTWKVGLFEAHYRGGVVSGDGGFFVEDEQTGQKEDRVISRSREEVVLKPTVVLKGGFKDAKAAAFGTFKHVFTDPETQKAVRIPDEWRRAFERLIVDGASGSK
ncbi:hypothetical protein ACM66B_002283 [Microbotryomycetes sp. NB124-2]